MGQIVDAGSIQLDAPKSNLPAFDIALKPGEDPEAVARQLVASRQVVVPAGSIKLDAPKTEPGVMDRIANIPSDFAHTTRAIAETGAGLATGLAAFPISKGTKWIEYVITGDLEKAKQAEERASRRIQFVPETEEARGALEKISKYALEPVFGTLHEMGAVPGEAWKSKVAASLGGDIAEIAAPIKIGKKIKEVREYRGAKPAEATVLADAEYGPTVEAGPQIVDAGSIKLDDVKAEVKPETETAAPPEGFREILPDENLPPGSRIRIDMESGKAFVKVEERAEPAPAEASPGAEPINTAQADALKTIADREAEKQPVEPPIEAVEAAIPKETTEAPRPGEIVEPGATSGAISAPEGETGIKNAVTEAERAARGQSEVEVEARRSFGEAFDEGKRLVDAGESDPRLLAKEMADNPRPLKAEESATLIYDRMRLQNEHKSTMDAIEKAIEDGDAVKEQDARVRLERIEEDINTNDTAARRTGYEQGLGLAARRMMIKQDYSLAAMLQRARIDNGGKPVSAEMRAKYEALAKRIEEANAKIAEHESKIAELEANRGLEKVRADVAKEKRQSKRAIKKEDLATEFSGLVKELNDALGGLHAGVDPTAALILGKMAKNRVHSGIITVEGLIDSIYTEVKKAGIDISKRDIRDAISGYGITSTMSKDAINVQLRELKRQMRLISALEDAKSGKSPLRSGLQRDVPTDTVRALERQVHQAMRESGIDSKKARSPEEQWKTALDAIKSRLKNQLFDITKQLATGEKTPKKPGIKYDYEAEVLKQLRDGLKAILVEAEGKPEMSAEQRVKLATSAVEKSIAEYERRIKESELTPPKRESKTPETPALKALRDRRDALKAQYAEMQKAARPEKDPRVAALKRAMDAAENSIKEYERRIQEKDLAPKKKESIVKETPELKALRATRDALKKTYRDMQKEAKPQKTPEEIALQSFKTRTTNKIKELENRLASKDFTTKKRREVEYDKEGLDLQFKLEQAKKAYNEARLKDKLANRNMLQKAVGGVAEAANLIRALKTSFDLSAVFRQGGLLHLGDPRLLKNSATKMFRALGSEKAEFAINKAIEEHPYHRLAQKAGLELTEKGTDLSKMEEVYMSRHAGKIPGIGASQRAYTTNLNVLRFDKFVELYDNLVAGGLLRRGGKPTDAELKVLGDFVNQFTGRGTVHGKANALVALNTTFFAPRFVLSRFQSLVGQSMWGGTGRTRLLIAKEYAKTLTGLAVVVGMGLMAGGEFETDPRSSDFGKIKFGNTRIDVFSGLSQVTTLLARIATGETKRASGKIVPIRGENVPYGSGNTADVIARFLRTKLAPVPGTALDIVTGKDVVGQKVTAESVPEKLVVPLAFADIYSAMKENGVPGGTALGILSIFGFGLQVYDPNNREQGTMFDVMREELWGEASAESGARSRSRRR